VRGVNPLYEALPVFAQNVACSAAGLQRRRQRFTPHFWRTLLEWEHWSGACDDELHAIQALRLADTLDHARKSVPHYADLTAMLRCSDPREAVAKTLAEIPPLDKRTYRDSPRDFLSTSEPRLRWVQGRTSGTTGTALRLWYTPVALAEEYATVWRMRRRCGVSPSDPHLTFGGRMVVPFRAKEPPFWRIDAALNQTLFSLYHMSERNLPAYVEAVHSAKAVYAQGYPSSLHLIARALLESGRPLPKGKLAAVFTSSESVLATQRATIEAAFGAPLRDRYGASEFAVSMTACDAGKLHVDMEFCIVEVEPQEENADWVRGPLLVTGFANRAVPFIRYRIGDIGTRLKRACPCGRAGDVFESVDGRIEDYVVTPDGRVVGRLDHIFKTLSDVAEAQIVQPSVDRIVIYVVRAPTFNDASERALLREARARLGEEIGITIECVSSIARQPNGKLRAVRSLVSPRIGEP
jgi:phenylacetate-CoA ligase